jgi:hypothetical protein
MSLRLILVAILIIHAALAADDIDRMIDFVTKGGIGFVCYTNWRLHDWVAARMCRCW